MSSASVIERMPRFEPHALLKGGHAQTIAASFFRGRQFPYRAVKRRIVLDDGDLIVLHDDCPENWNPVSPTVLLIHGLAGDHTSNYMTRIAGKLNEAGVRAIRMDLRACGAGEGASRLPYTPGISEDLKQVVEHVANLCPVSPLILAGFSIGGNIALKLLGENADALPPQLSRAVVVNPPIDLRTCLANMQKFSGRIYDRHLVKHVFQQFHRSDLLKSHAPHVATAKQPRGMREFDSLYASPAWGYGSVDEYYEAASALPNIHRIRVPVLLIASYDDPIVPVATFESLDIPDSMAIHLTHGGGHLGFIGKAGIDPDRRWMDWRVIDYVLSDQPAQLQIAA